MHNAAPTAPNLECFNVLLVSGEASSDQHAALFVSELRVLAPNVSVFGMGGSALRAAGMETNIDSEHSAAVMGITELFGALLKIIHAYRALLRLADERKPDLAVLLDFPDFNLRLAKSLERRGIPVLYFISPQLWAWRSGRVRTMQRSVKRIAAIFPFEEEFYRKHGVDARYVGHPFADIAFPCPGRIEFLRSVGASSASKMLALLPGSRRAEVTMLLPDMLAASERLRAAHPDLQVLVPVAPTVKKELLSSLIGEHRPYVHLVSGKAREILSVADAAVVASGTATVEAALAGVPFVVVYRLSPLSYRIARFLVRGVQHFAMVNLIAGRKIVEELLQDEVTPVRISAEIERLFGTDGARTREALAEVRNILRVGGGAGAGSGAARKTAEMALELLEEAR